jgi:dGTPase
VSQIARTIAKVLRLHEELTEAIALGHDLGHPPFGHAGERVIDQLMPGGFNHYEQSLRVIDVLENDRRGLNLTWEVRDGIAKHSKGKEGAPVGMSAALRAETVEGQIMRVADLIAYVNHDIDDATRAGLLRPDDLPRDLVAALGATSSARISTLVRDVVTETLAGGLTEIRMSEPVLQAMLGLRSFLFDAVYENSLATVEFRKASDILSGLWEKLKERPEAHLDPVTIEAEGLDAATRDFVAGMTDRYAVRLFEELFIPKPWAVD